MKGASGFAPDFVDMLRALAEAGAEFLVVGAHAMAVHGVPRATGDLDVLVRPSADNAVRVLAALRSVTAPVRLGHRAAKFYDPPQTSGRSSAVRNSRLARLPVEGPREQRAPRADP